jgi:hypothetical protein
MSARHCSARPDARASNDTHRCSTGGENQERTNHDHLSVASYRYTSLSCWQICSADVGILPRQSVLIASRFWGGWWINARRLTGAASPCFGHWTLRDRTPPSGQSLALGGDLARSPRSSTHHWVWLDSLGALTRLAAPLLETLTGCR